MTGETLELMMCEKDWRKADGTGGEGGRHGLRLCYITIA